jgi:MFS family permease
MGFASILAGCLTTGPLMDTLGRKGTLLVANAPFILGWTLLCLAPKPAPVALLYFARLLNGFGAGMVRSALPSFTPMLSFFFLS